MFEEPLLDAIARAHHDPDPNRAFRFKPFFYGVAREPAASRSAAPVSAPRPFRLPRLLTERWPLRSAPAATGCCCCSSPAR
ncbi:MAG TPA: hypothetical protein VFU81_11125 [Thermomicrobiales bacterium]|nr:hypothetical protein [Thermomicrobiales bacterium]